MRVNDAEKKLSSRGLTAGSSKTSCPLDPAVKPRDDRIFSHVDESGKAQMVDVGDKKLQQRFARAEGSINLNEQTISLIKENQIKKGDVLAVAKIAGICAAKQTPNLIPLCHQLNLNKIDINFEFIEDGIKATSLVKCTGKTGVEMEALTAVNIALLTIYDMCKAVDKNMEIQNIKLIEKVKRDV